jgi:hypothetical protein
MSAGAKFMAYYFVQPDYVSSLDVRADLLDGFAFLNSPVESRAAGKEGPEGIESALRLSSPIGIADRLTADQ